MVETPIDDAAGAASAGASGRGAHVAVVLASVVCGGANLGLGVAHLHAIFARALAGSGMGDAKEFAYDFHFVSLVLIGFLLVIPGALCLWRVVGLARRRRAAWSGALRATLVLAAVNGALMPVQGFAILLGAAAGLNLVVLLAFRRRYGQADRKPEPAATATEPAA